MQRRLIQVFLGTIFGIIFCAIPAFAHTELIATFPTANTTFTGAPEQISLTFSEAPLLAGARIEVQQPLGNVLKTATPKLSGTTLSIPWPDEIQPGRVNVFWRAVADDGHVVSSAFHFDYQQAVAPSISATPTQSGNTTNWRQLGAICFVAIILLGFGALTLFNRKQSR